ncbi:protein Asterix-like [Scaptodrosophila lebanonensis]|uniref:Protein Asterix-like n=1 Tax=Drosophila lebanonensis TaxID=7225 RepID=A0A6J2T2Z7_DROLE|nr:protein Asterix-like [Scaptodrosophila lebanonensis]
MPHSKAPKSEGKASHKEDVSADPRCKRKIIRYKPPLNRSLGLSSDYVSLLGMFLSVCGLTLRLKWCSWLSLYCSCVSFATSREVDFLSQGFPSYVVCISALVMAYMRDPEPMTLPWN